MKLLSLAFCVFGALSHLGAEAFIAKPSFAAKGKYVGGGSRVVTKAIVEHFEGNPVTLIGQVSAVGSFITYGYVLANNEEVEECEVVYEGEETEKEVDIYRDTPLRYMGYANELGEAFRPLVDVKFVLLGYVAALGYVFADAASKALAAPQKNCMNFEGTDKNPNICAIPALAEVLSFQLLASVALPGFTINRWVLFLSLLVEKYDETFGQLPDLVQEWLPTLGGLALIPLIVKPLDLLVEKFLEATLQPYLENTFPLCTVKVEGSSEE
uniref:Mitochondrial fission process protein 1 n=1 Tax=Heterosigma akashiwo TaxID=2829 RepID=A0A6S9JYQ6_HETAK